MCQDICRRVALASAYGRVIGSKSTEFDVRRLSVRYRDRHVSNAVRSNTAMYMIVTVKPRASGYILSKKLAGNI